MFCFDNTFSTMSEKIIFFELILDNMDDGEDPETWKEYVQGADLLDMKLEDIMVREHIRTCWHLGTENNSFTRLISGSEETDLLYCNSAITQQSFHKIRK